MMMLRRLIVFIISSADGLLAVARGVVQDPLLDCLRVLLLDSPKLCRAAAVDFNVKVVLEVPDVLQHHPNRAGAYDDEGRTQVMGHDGVMGRDAAEELI